MLRKLENLVSKYNELTEPAETQTAYINGPGTSTPSES